LWRAALGELQLAMPKANYDTCFKETYVVSEEDDVFCVGVPNAFAREWLENKYRGHVRASLQRLVGRTAVVAGAVRIDARVVHDDGGALRRQQHRLAAADAAPRTGNDCNFACESVGHGILLRFALFTNKYSRGSGVRRGWAGIAAEHKNRLHGNTESSEAR